MNTGNITIIQVIVGNNISIFILFEIKLITINAAADTNSDQTIENNTNWISSILLEE